MELTFHGSDKISRRKLFSLRLDSPVDLPTSLDVKSSHFVCVLAWDVTEVLSAVIGKFVDSLLDSGAVYICCWGPECERFHDIIDEELAAKNLNKENKPVIMTTWHDDEELTEVIEFGLTSTEPDEAFSSECNAFVAISVGSMYWAAQSDLHLSRHLLRQII